ncbi:NPC intracellular cholesterol transporter 2-like [Wyeomyia smithii]|uniref:NPC intracellular cholesterol transporter 2-like n=1 Tax=Wyeomyia smithii TaxID=174621 RepID=UPI002467EAB6|nr:NPC intracellular cholesterol transporter 2-like [Wyeomyia smithii]
MIKYILLAAIIPAVMLQNSDNVDHTQWDIVAARPCGGLRPFPANVRMENCPAMPCPLVRGSDANMAMEFTALKDASSLHTRVRATALGITVPYELPAERAAACNWLIQSRCPITAGEDLIYHLSMPITAIYPLISVTIEIDLVDDTDQSHGCFVVDTRVVAN